MQDRPYQDAGHAAIRKELIAGTERQLISMATGTGKTVMFSKLPEKLGDILPGQMLVLAHREELIDQAIAKIQSVNPKFRIDKEKAEHRADPSVADVIVASVASLGRKGNARLKKYNWDKVDKIVTDEAHHSIADSYMNVYEAAGILTPRSNQKRILLGVTATPSRGDGKAMAALYQKITYVYSMRQAIEDGWLVDVKGIRVKTDTSLDGVKSSGGDFQDNSLADAINNPQRNQLIVKAWMERGQGRQSIGFTANIQHALDLAAMFRHFGVKAEAVWGDDPERAEKLALHRAGEITILLNCGVLTEGYDDWAIGCVILARPTKSAVLYVQMVGRGTRLEEGCGNLNHIIEDCSMSGHKWKKDCIILDVVDASANNTLVTLPTLMGMASGLDLKGQSLIKTVQRIEQEAKEHPAVDFSKLQSLDDIKTLIENVDLFDVKLPQEVTANSQLCWHNAATGGYMLLLPNKEEVRIRQNMLDKYELVGIIKGQRYIGTRDTLNEAFAAADKLVADKCPEVLKVVRQEAAWHDDPPSEGQLKLLMKLFKGRQLPLDLTKGKASKIISAHFAGK